jgi:hypothetical protein
VPQHVRVSLEAQLGNRTSALHKAKPAVVKGELPLAACNPVFSC